MEREKLLKVLKWFIQKKNETADQYIEKILDDIGRVKKVRVATSDWMEQQIVLGEEVQGYQLGN